jgi:hypothetical protein
MIYTEYFVRGTQPTTLCPLHPSPSFMDKIAGLFGAGEPTGKPVHAEEAGLPPSQAGTTGAHPPASPGQKADTRGDERSKDEKVEEEPKKRGFWARVFGRDKKKDDRKEDSKQEPKRNPGNKGGER